MNGGCLCGAIRYRVGAPPQWSVICHCSTCRKASGAASVAWVTFERGAVEWLEGQPQRFASSDGVLRQFCGICGTGLSYETADWPAHVDLNTASLDDPAAFPPTAEVWVGHRLPWTTLSPATHRYSEGLAAGGAPAPNRISFVELPAAAAASTGAVAGFYTRAFDWTMVDFGPTYACTLSGDVDLGLQADPAEATQSPLPVIQVAELGTTRVRVEAAGGVITREIFAFPGGRRFHFTDPAGNELAAMQPG